MVRPTAAVLGSWVIGADYRREEAVVGSDWWDVGREPEGELVDQVPRTAAAAAGTATAIMAPEAMPPPTMAPAEASPEEIPGSAEAGDAEHAD